MTRISFVLVASLILAATLAAAPAAAATHATVATSSTALIGPASSAPAAPSDNPITIENQQPGSYGWLHGPLMGDDTALQIKGYWSSTSVKQGERIDLKVTVNPAQTFSVDIYRMGWYQGYGGRLRQHVGPVDGVAQPACPQDSTTGLTECNWSTSYALTVPSDWTSGFYVALLTNAAGYQNHAVFVVRDDRPAPLLYKMAIATEQAFNNFPNDGVTGKSTYPFNSYGANTISGEPRAVKVSFDRPYADHGFGQVNDIEFIRWVERSGYDITYATDIDAHANGAMLRSHKAVLSVGHNQYWSKEMYDAAEAARDAGTGIAFLGAAPLESQVRFEASSSGAPNRVMVSYKTASLDPVQGPTTTTRFRWAPVNRPEQPMVGVQFDSIIRGDTIGYVAINTSHWIYAGTGLRDGDVIPGILGTTMDAFMTDTPGPNSTSYTLLSDSPYTDYVGAAKRANSSIYRAPSGAFVFAAGTLGWIRGLDGFWYGKADARVQRITANLFNAFISGPPADHLVVTAPAAAAAGQPFTLDVSAVDAYGAVAAGYSGTVHFSSSDSAAGVVLPSDSTLSNGRGSFSATLKTVGPQTITASDAGASFTATANVTVNAPQASRLVVSTSATPVAGSAFSFTVIAQDADGNTVPSYAGTVHFTSSDTSSGVVLPADSALTNGQRTFSATLTKAGAQTITARDTATTSLTGQTTVNVRAASATRFVVTAAAQSTAGASFSFSVTAQDQFANIDAAYAGTVRFTSSDTSTGVVLPAASTLTAGQRTFSATLTKAGAQTITATDSAAASITGSATLTIVPASAASLNLDAPGSARSGQSFPVKVTLTDQFGNVATGYRGTVHFTTSDPLPLVVLPSDHSFTAADAGTHTFQVTLRTIPSQSITVRDTGNATLTDTQQISITLL